MEPRRPAPASHRQLAAYLARIGLDAPPTPDAAGLARLQQAHREAIAFENLDVRLGRGIAIGSEPVFDKLVLRRRGGYCFEQNRLYADMLAALGIASRALLARVLLGPPLEEPPARSHMLLLAQVAGESWILDAGFGGSFVPPLPLAEGVEVTSADGAHHRLVRSGARGGLTGEWQLQRAGPAATNDGRTLPHGDWQPQYSFDLAEVGGEDLEQANHWTASHPLSRFVQGLMVTTVRPQGFGSLIDRSWTESGQPDGARAEIESPQEYRRILHEHFGLELSEAEIAGLGLFGG